VKLVGYGRPEAEYRPGHVLPLDLYWQVLARPAADYQLRVQLLNEQGQVVQEVVGSPSRDGYPPTAWGPGELLRGQAELVIPGDIQPGQYRLRAALLDPRSGRPLPAGPWPWARAADLGALEVVAWPLETELPPIAVPLEALFGSPPLAELRGYELAGADGLPPEAAAPGEALILTLLWRSLTGEWPTSFHVFVHLVDADGAVVAQGDGPPVGGFRPTTSWRPGEVLLDGRILQVPAEARPGDYALWVGLYDPEGGARLPAFLDGAEQPDDRLLLRAIRVEGRP
jgi:hypothetical protein